jgi:peptidoglycan/xylan/chitin deacetylase (PgdA/CDA1 family)
MSRLDEQQDRLDPEKGIPDGISIVGLVLLLVIVLSTLVASLGMSSKQEKSLVTEAKRVSSPTTEIVQTEEALASIQITERPATMTPSPTPIPLDTETSTPSPTATPIDTPESTVESEPTPTVTPTMTYTPFPTYTPTSTPSPTPLPTPYRSISRTLRVPILMYHYVSVPPEGADKYRNDLSVTPEQFRQQMQYLSENGYNTIDLYDLSRAVTDKQELPPKSVIVTIDDGYRDNYENAFPILQEFGFEATFFLATDFIDRGLPGYMTWDMIREMAEAGMRFEPHSKTHPDLTGQDREYVIYQILGSMETIDAQIGSRPRYFNYPSGRYDEQVLEILEELDFWGAVTTNGGAWHGFEDRYEWTRLRVRNVTGLSGIIDMIE